MAGTIKVSNIVNDGTGTPPTIKDSAGTEIGRLARVHVNFNGTGTIAVRASLNVSGLTDNGTGNYTVNYTNAISDSNYSSHFGNQRTRASADWGYMGSFNVTTGSIQLVTTNTAGTATDYEGVDLAIFR